MTHELSTRDILQQEKIGTRRLAAPRPTRGIVRRWVYLYNIVKLITTGASTGSKWVGAVRRQQALGNGLKEEMMAYLDWDKSENDGLDVKLADEIVAAPFSSRRGPEEIWRACEEDSKEQQALYSAP